MSFDSESGHWYKTDGSPCYQVPAKSKGPGGMRGVDLRWDRHLKLVPSVTTVLSVIDKPALTNWLIEQAVMGALTIPRVDGESEAELMSRIKVDGRAQAKAAAEEGTRIHDAIEQSFAKIKLFDDGEYSTFVSEAYESQYDKHVSAVHYELRRLFPDVNDWISEKSFAHPLGYGGKVDLHSPSTGIVVDFKTKDGDFSDGKKLAYDQNIQLAAYQVGLGLHDCIAMQDESQFVFGDYYHTRCANIFVSRTHPGKVASHVWSADEIARGWRLFDKALALWKELKQYDGAFA